MASEPPVCCIVDSGILIGYLRERPYTRELLSAWSENGVVGISIMTVLEVLQELRRSEEVRTFDTLAALLPIPLDEELVYGAGRMLQEFRAKGITLGVPQASLGPRPFKRTFPC